MAATTGCKRKRDQTYVWRDQSPTSDPTTKKSRCNGELEPDTQPQTTNVTKGVPRLSRSFARLHETISLTDLSELLHYAAFGKTNGVPKPRWCRLHHQSKLSGVNVTILEDVTQLHFYRYYTQFNHLRRSYRTRCSLLPCSGSVPSVIFSTELPSSRPSPPGSQGNSPNPVGLSWHPVLRKFGSETRGLTAYLLTAEEMSKRSFPLKGSPGCGSFVCTERDGHVTDSSPLYGLDCEMCLTERGNELTRVALVDSSGRCVLDELVKPHSRILNYLTRFSGITRSMLQPVTTRLADVQSKVIQALPRDAVLVGHSLDNDLRALNIIHPHVIDTSLLYHREFGQRFKLKTLAEVVLKREIQSEEREGHDPCEDAIAAVELAQYFISRGPREVVKLHLEELWGGLPTIHQSPVNGLTNGSLHNHNISSLRFGHALHRTGQSALHLGRSAVIDSPLSNQLWRRHSCSSDKEVLAVFRRVAESYSLSLVEFSSFSQHLKLTAAQRSHQHAHKMIDRQREMCVVYAGPLPNHYTERDVRRRFRCCGALRLVRLLTATQRLHAVVEFEQLEGAVLAVDSLNALQLHGCAIKVQRPVTESTLDLDVSLRALQDDLLNDHVIYVSGFPTHDPCNLQATFGRFGPIQGVSLPAEESGKRSRHAFIKYESSESAEAAVSSSVEFQGRKLKVCHALTPPHLSSWTNQTTHIAVETNGETAEMEEEDEETGLHCGDEREMERLMREMDVRVGKLFKALPHNTLSIVILPGRSARGVIHPGLCFIEVIQRSSA